MLFIFFEDHQFGGGVVDDDDEDVADELPEGGVPVHQVHGQVHDGHIQRTGGETRTEEGRDLMFEGLCVEGWAVKHPEFVGDEGKSHCQHPGDDGGGDVGDVKDVIGEVVGGHVHDSGEHAEHGIHDEAFIFGKEVFDH